VNGSQTFEMPSSDGRTTWTVTFEPRPDAKRSRLKGIPLAFVITAELVAGLRRCDAYWGIEARSALLWVGEPPADEAQRHQCYQRAAVRHCRRHLDEIVSQEEFKHFLREEDLALVLNVGSGDVLQEIEHDIDEVLDSLPDIIAMLDQRRHEGGSGFRLSRQVPVAWKKHEPNLRRMRDSDERFARAYEETAEFYDVYQRHLEKLLLPIQAAEIAADLGQANTLGHHAVRALYAARQPARISVVKDTSLGTDRGWPADRAVHLRRITLENLRCFGRVDVPVGPPEHPWRGQWIVLLGENGMGKTTLLRALALALLPEHTGRNHVYELSARAGLIRNAHEGYDAHGRVERIRIARIEVETGPDTDTSLIIVPMHPREALSAQRPLRQRPLVLGYGCRRGSALGDIRRESNTDYLFGTETLFDEDARVIHADTWLRDIHAQDRDLFDSVCRILGELLLGVERISVEPGGITWAEGPIIGRVPLAGLSDGYLTTLGWLVDVLARWIAYARSHDIPLGPDFHKRMPCVVLIDEIDLHLHPRWQTEVITKLRDMFPMTTFVATTHNPLTLHGTKAGEVHVIRVGDDGNLEIVPKDLPPGIRTDELLTGEWFGLSSTLDAETQQLLKDHFTLLQQGRPEGDPERVEIEEKLRARLGHFAATPAERRAQEIIAMDPAARPVTDEDRARLRAIYEQRLRDDAEAMAQGQQSDEP
jgi:hypothetical protein